MQKRQDYYLRDDLLGEGQSCKVYRGVNKIQNIYVALKYMNKIKKSIYIEESIKSQIQILTKLSKNNSKHNLKFIQSFKDSNNITVIVTQYCNGGNLKDYVQKFKYLSEQEALSFINQIISAFLDLYKIKVLHRDLKPSNILIHNGIVKVADFGISVNLSNQQNRRNTFIGSMDWMAPQRINQNQYGMKSDIYSLGATFYFMLTGKNYKDFKDLSSIKNIKIKQFILKTLEPQPSKRISWKQIFVYDFGQANNISSNIFKYRNVDNRLTFNNCMKNIQQLNQDLSNIKQAYSIELQAILFPLVFLHPVFEKLDKQNLQISLRVPYATILRYILFAVQNLKKQLQQKKNTFNHDNFKKFTQSPTYEQTLKMIFDTQCEVSIHFYQALQDASAFLPIIEQRLTQKELDRIFFKRIILELQLNIQIHKQKKLNDKITMLLAKYIILMLVVRKQQSIYAYQQRLDSYGSYNIEKLEGIIDELRSQVICSQ